MPDNVGFVWPSAGAMKVTLLRGGGCNLRITFAERGIVRSIGRGQVIRAVAVPTKRIARRYEILIRHDNDFESSYSIIDQTPKPTVTGLRRLSVEGGWVDDGTEIYDVQNGGFLDLHLSHKGKLVDPRSFIQGKFDGAVEVIHQAPGP